MSAIIPILMSSPYPVTHYLPDYGSASAVREQTAKQQTNHREVMGALKDLAKGKIAVTVRAADVLPAIHAALERLQGPVNDYDKAAYRWRTRYSRVQAWQRRRAEAKERTAKAAEAARREAEAVEYQREHSRWWRRVSIEAARNKVAAQYLSFGRGFDYYGIYSAMYDLGRSYEGYRSHPRKPAGYDDLPAIRELRDAASLHPDAVLSVPVEVITKLQRWAA